MFPQDGGADLASILLRDGLVRHRPDRAAKPCRQRLLDAEAPARDARRGAWADPALGVVEIAAGADPAGIGQEAAEGMVVVEGLVASVGETPTRLFLNLGRARGFAISAAKRDIALMASDEVSMARAAGARVRVRGLIDRAAGLRLELTDADALELVEPAPAGDAKR